MLLHDFYKMVTGVEGRLTRLAEAATLAPWKAESTFKPDFECIEIHNRLVTGTLSARGSSKKASYIPACQYNQTETQVSDGENWLGSSLCPKVPGVPAGHKLDMSQQCDAAAEQPNAILGCKSRGRKSRL